MKDTFAALSFPADVNLAGRIYWYRLDFVAAEGEKVLAPIGPHDRLQCATVEKILLADEEDAPYDLRLIKRVAARYGDRRAGHEGKILEFGGVRYDEKHYTPFRRLFLAREEPAEEDTEALGITLRYTGGECPAFYEAFARERGAVLVTGGEGEKIFKSLYAFLRGDGDARLLRGVSEKTAAELEAKLR